MPNLERFRDHRIFGAGSRVREAGEMSRCVGQGPARWRVRWYGSGRILAKTEGWAGSIPTGKADLGRIYGFNPPVSMSVAGPCPFFMPLEKGYLPFSCKPSVAVENKP